MNRWFRKKIQSENKEREGNLIEKIDSKIESLLGVKETEIIFDRYFLLQSSHFRIPLVYAQSIEGLNYYSLPLICHVVYVMCMRSI